MSSTQYSPQLRPLSVGEVLDASFKIVRQSFGTLAGLRARRGGAAEHRQHADHGVGERRRVRPRQQHDRPARDSPPAREVAGTLVTAMLTLVLMSLAVGRVLPRRVGGLSRRAPDGRRVAAVRDEPAAAGDRAVVPLCPRADPGVHRADHPGIWLAVAWSVSFPALLSENLGPVAALGRSFKLVQGRWWPAFGALLVMYLLVMVISGILGALFGATLIAAAGNEGSRGSSSRSSTRSPPLITLPLMAAVLTVVYFDLRVRKEGFDLQLLARGVGQDESAYATSPRGRRARRAGSAAAATGAAAGERRCSSTLPAPAPAPEQSGGFAPPQAPSGPDEPLVESTPPPSQGGLQSGDPLAGPDPPERREGDGGSAS